MKVELRNHWEGYRKRGGRALYLTFGRLELGCALCALPWPSLFHFHRYDRQSAWHFRAGPLLAGFKWHQAREAP